MSIEISLDNITLPSQNAVSINTSTEKEIQTIKRCQKELEFNMANISELIKGNLVKSQINIIEIYLLYVYIELFLKYHLTPLCFKEFEDNIKTHNLRELYDKIKDTHKIDKSYLKDINRYISHLNDLLLCERPQLYPSLRYNFRKERNADFTDMKFIITSRSSIQEIDFYKTMAKAILR